MRAERGFTIVEILVAVMILSVGLLGLVTTAGLVTRMVAQGQRYTEASALANRRIELLRAQGCPAAVTAQKEALGPYTVAWDVTAVGTTRGRRLSVQVTYPTTRGPRSASFQTVHYCP